MKYTQNMLQQDLLKAVALFKDGALEEVHALLQKIVAHIPTNAVANVFLARVLVLKGQFDEALSKLENGLAHGVIDDGSRSLFLDSLRDLHVRAEFKVMQRAAESLLANRKDDGEGWNLLGASLLAQEKAIDALEAFQKARQLLPNRADLLVNLGAVLTELDKPDEAIAILNKAIELQDVASIKHIAFNNLGSAYRHKKEYVTAVACFEKALAIEPDYPEALSNLGLISSTLGKYEQVIEYLTRAIALQPNMLRVYSILADSYKTLGRLREAMDTCEAALAINVEQPYVWAALGDILRDANHIDESIQSYINSLSYRTPATETTSRRAYTSLLFTINYHPDLSEESIYQAYEEFDRRYCSHTDLSKVTFNNSRNPDRRLKVAYVCQNFCNQVCMHFLLPLIEKHDHDVVELYAYTDGVRVDSVTEMYQNAVEHWIVTKDMTDAEIAQRIREDEIDILVDVSGHTTDNRLMVFSYKPAPISMHWLEFGYTTGMKAIDYYLCDRPTIPVGFEHLFSEKPWRLDGVPYCYRPRSDTGPVGPLPALKNGYVTIGTLSRAIRINHHVIRVWAAILNALPTAHLIINSNDFRDENAQEEMKLRFAQYGIEPARLEIACTSPPWDVMRQIDIGLDCFPHNSGTTLFETLYMGQPFVTLAGRPSVGRLGASILEGLGRPEWIAYSQDEYVQKVVSLAGDIPALANIRETQREVMRSSPLMDEPGFARSVEKGFRQMWQKFCEENA